MKALHIHAGPRARQHLEQHGLQPADVHVIPAAAGGMLTERGRAHVHELDALFSSQRNISPGGSADLLAVTYFLHKIELWQARTAE